MTSLTSLIRIPISQRLGKYAETYQWLKNMGHNEYVDTQVLIKNKLNEFSQKITSEATKSALLLCVKYLYLEYYKYSLYGTRHEDDGRERKKEFEDFLVSFFSERLEKNQQVRGSLVEGIGRIFSANNRYFLSDIAKKHFYQILENESNLDLILPQYILRNTRFDDEEKSILNSNFLSIVYQLGRHTYYASHFQFPTIRDGYAKWKDDIAKNDAMISKIDSQIESESNKFFKSKSTIDYLKREKNLHIQQREAFCAEILIKFSQYQLAFSIVDEIQNSIDEIQTIELILECMNAIKEKIQLKHLLLEKGFELAELNSFIK